jgi:acyl-CoA thioester hydrolase
VPVVSPFELPIRIEAADLDVLGHVNNVVYVRWVQEAAIAHWMSATSGEEQAALVWVVARHEIDYEKPALPGDELLARTWVGEAEGLLFARHTEILRLPSRERLARARTMWCPLDPRTGRPCRVPPSVRERFSTSAERETRGA